MAQQRDPNRGRAKYCSRRCSGSVGASVVCAKYPQQGEGNFNYINGRSKTPFFYAKRDRQRHPERWRARKLLQNAVKRGDIIKPKACVGCQQVRPLHGHHDDHAHPFVVTCLCRPCHDQLHREMREALLAAS